MTDDKILHVVHCVDTEGPLLETLEATFERLKSIFGISLDATQENLKLLQNQQLDFDGKEAAIAKCFSPELLKYNSNWEDLEEMLDDLMSDNFRNRYHDDFNNGWVYSWHCMDHVGYVENPRQKDLGYGNIFNFYNSKLKNLKNNSDELNWHFHPLSFLKKPTQAATSYVNSYDILTQILCRRILDNNWFPIVNRPGFHAERPDSHLFLEQWIPYDFANQSFEELSDQPDLSNGRFGDWSRAPKTWRGYKPSHDDYQIEGTCRRTIFRCLNVGTRLRTLRKQHVREAFLEVEDKGSAILAFANHDYRDMRPDVYQVQVMLREIKSEFPNVKIKYSGAEEAATQLMGFQNKEKPKLLLNLEDNRLIVELLEGEIFGPQPFLAIKTNEETYYHDNLDIIEPKRRWSYVFDDQTLDLHSISKIGVGTAGLFGKRSVVQISVGEGR